MKKLAFLFSALLALNAAANTQINLNDPIELQGYMESEIEQFELEQTLFETPSVATLNVEDIQLVELEESVEINFDTTAYLPERFNANLGMHDVDWNEVQLVELEEDVDLGFDPKKYLPKNFNAKKGMKTSENKMIVVSLY